MMKKIMALWDEDEEYVYRLQELLSRRDSFPFTVSAYTDMEAFREELNKGRFALVLGSEVFYGTVCEAEGKKRPPVILLKDKSGENIRKEIMEKYPSQAETLYANAGDKKTLLIGVFSPVCRSIQTSFSLLTGQFLAKKGSVLYLNFEPFSGLNCLLENAADRVVGQAVVRAEIPEADVAGPGGKGQE